MIDLDELERALVPMDKTLSVRQERYGMARVGVEHAPGAVEVIGEFVLLKHAKEYAALRNAAPELIAMARRWQWLPIETAPDDMTESVVVRWTNSDGEECRELDHKSEGCWIGWHDHAEHVEVIGGHGVKYEPPYTHWMPLPDAPQEQKR